MKKDEFIGYLTALKDMSEANYFSEEEFYDVLNTILDKAKELDLNYNYPTYPYYPNWYDPYKQTSITTSDPNNWQIKCNTAPNFTVVK